MTHDNLARPVKAGEPIKPWLILGPFYEDMSAAVQGLTYFERNGATVGRAAMADVQAQAIPLLQTPSREGQAATFRGHPGVWRLVRRPEPFLAWGQYNIANHLGAAFLSTRLTPNQPGLKTWRLVTRITSQVMVALNGQLIFDTAGQPVERQNGYFEYTFSAELTAGENILTLAMFRLGRMAQVGCFLSVDGDVQVRIPLAAEITAERRGQVEESVNSIRLPQDIFYPEHTVGFELGVCPPETVVQAELFAEAGQSVGQMVAQAAGPVSLGQGNDLTDGTYRLVCTWRDAQARPITSAGFEIRKVSPMSAPPGYDAFPQRQQLALETFAAAPKRAEIRANMWIQLARYALCQYDQIDESAIREVCRFIADRKDCADFVIQAVLRLMYFEREDPKLSPDIHALMKDTILGFKYWVDEPGDTVMYMGSENHRLLFHVAEWLAGQLFPTEEFTNSRQRGLYHATKGRMYITEWLRQRGRYGFDEWHSNSYYPICIAPLLNVYDFAIGEDYKLRQMAAGILDVMFFNMAADSLNGIFGTTHGRSYGVYVKYPDFEGTSATGWILYGVGSLIENVSPMSPVSLATSAYYPPQILYRLATDKQAVVESRQRHGILRRGIHPGGAAHANFRVFRTPDYMISGLQDHRKGEYESSTHVAQVTLGKKVVIFWSCPHTSGEGSGLRPDYWSGHATLPRVIQQRNVMALTWRLDHYAWMSHCFFEQSRMDEVRLDGNWAFARVGKGYVGIYSQNGMTIGGSGQYAGRELICQAQENTWLVECGREAEWDSFDEFVAALKGASITVEDGVITYDSPTIGAFVTGWDVTPTAGGEPIELDRYPLVESPWAYSQFGSGVLTIEHDDEIYEVWLNQ